MLWHDFLAPKAEFRVDWDKICIITPYRAMTNYIQEYLHRQGLDLTTSTVDPWDAGNISHPAQDAPLDPAMELWFWLMQSTKQLRQTDQSRLSVCTIQ